MKGYRQIVVGLAVLTLLVLIGVLYHLVSGAKEDAPLVIEDNGLSNVQPTPHTFDSGLEERSVWSLPEPSMPKATGSARGGSGAAKPTTSANAILARIRAMISEDESFSPQHADEVSDMVRQLVALGADALPVVREYLESGENIQFRISKDGVKFEYPSMRVAMIVVMAEVGGTEALSTCSEMLPKVSSPLEMAMLTYAVEKIAPGQHQDQILFAAHAQLEKLSTPKVGKLTDLAPLFEVLQMYGDSNTVAALERAGGRCRYYAPVALAGMPNGAGIPALIRLAKDPQMGQLGNGDYALRSLAQVATRYPDARTALMEEAAAGHIAERAWPSIASSLGNAHLGYARPLFENTVSNQPMTQEELAARVGIIDQLMTLTVNPQALQSLAQSRNILLTYMNR
jgi:hypothetical protein